MVAEMVAELVSGLLESFFSGLLSGWGVYAWLAAWVFVCGCILV